MCALPISSPRRIRRGCGRPHPRRILRGDAPRGVDHRPDSAARRPAELPTDRLAAHRPDPARTVRERPGDRTGRGRPAQAGHRDVPGEAGQHQCHPAGAHSGRGGEAHRLPADPTGADGQTRRRALPGAVRLPAALLGLLGAGVAAAAAALVAGRTRAQRNTRRVAPPFTPQWTPGPPRYGVGVRHNVAVPMSDGVVLRAEVHYPTDPVSGAAAPGPFPVLVCVTPYGKKAPPPAAQLGGGASPYLITRGYIEVLVDVRGTGASDGAFEMFGARQTRDGVELVDWAATLPHASGRVGLFGLSYLGINQLFTAAAVGPGSPLRAIFPVMAATDFYRDAATMGGEIGRA